GKAFLAVYEKILAKDGQIEFKTDNSPLFDFAIEQAGEAGWQMEVCTFDLHNDAELSKGNVMTEYEEKFSAKGNPINKYIIKLPNRE
ncbi:MAG: tRNA (guanosine(46)-N7)-methyltransferase TrmB, partial [Lachnospiraceae bacterium]|nr:tRNA (guanosine(46)-N7)-methyltransferase TrmB [Lachnospiraceae bacterium]